jgi:hypothetical protein
MAAQIKNACGVCLREVTDHQQGIQCEAVCNRWFHRDCVRIPKADYDRLSADNSLKWECFRADCEDDNKKLTNSLMAGFAKLLTELSTKMETLLDLPKKIDAFDTKLTAFEDRIACTEKRLDALETTKASQVLKPEDIISEMNDRSRRASNIMIYNLDESSKKDTKAIKSHDENLTMKLHEATCPGLISYKFSTARLGKADSGKSRPLKVMLKCQNDALEILRNFSSEHLVSIDSVFQEVQ